ncbi:MAG: lysine--tRNA ligase [Aquificae bacterium]|nr:lysine--tRNA ligase [Aquificota bacterium]
MDEVRLKKLERLKELGINPYPYRFEVSDFIGNVRKLYEEEPPENYRVKVEGTAKRVSKTEEGFMVRLADEEGVEMPVYTAEEGLEQGKRYAFEGVLKRVEGKLSLVEARLTDRGEPVRKVKEQFDYDPQHRPVSLAGRLVSLRAMGKAAFGHLQDLTGKIQVYLKKDLIGEEQFQLFKELVDLGDFLGVRGKLFRTKTGELTVEVEEFQLLSKSLLPLPEKWHGLRDTELRYRQRYLDLIANPRARRNFALRAKLVSELRRFLESAGFIEAETPVLQPVASGANARPFKTYHNFLETELYLRIAPELYLKRLIVGGFPRVYELGKNFRNEGVDRSHNPEFTMVEFYAAYWDYHDLVRFTEELILHLAEKVLGTTRLKYGGRELDLSPPFRKVRYFELLEEKTGKGKEFFLHDLEGLRKLAHELGVKEADRLTHAKLLDKVFEKVAEPELFQPTFVLDFPKLLSPLAKTHREDEELVERFELYLAGYEVANAYTELNDPLEQKERFLQQLKERQAGDEEAMQMDEDFITALAYGMPPTAGEGIGVDRLAMIFAGEDSIREVILFPQLKPKK